MQAPARFDFESPPHAETNTVLGLIRDLRDQLIALFRQEVALAKAETSEKVARAGRNAVMIVIGAALAYAALLLLLAAASAGLYVGLVRLGLEFKFAIWVAPLIVAAIVAIIGTAMISKGKRTLNRQSLIPRQTLDELKETKTWAREKINPS